MRVGGTARRSLTWVSWRFRGGPVFKAHRWLYHSTLGSRVIKKKKKYRETEFDFGELARCARQGHHKLSGPQIQVVVNMSSPEHILIFPSSFTFLDNFGRFGPAVRVGGTARSGSEEGSYIRLVDLCITQL